MSGWIKCSDRLPEIDDECLIRMPVCGHFNVESARYEGEGVWIGAWCSARGKDKPYRVSHWMPRPDEPTE